MNIRLTKLFWRCCGDAARWLPSLEKPRLELPEPAARERLDRESGQQGEVRRSDAERTRRLRAAVRCALCQRVKTRRDCRDHLNTMTTSKSLKEIAQSRCDNVSYDNYRLYSGQGASISLPHSATLRLNSRLHFVEVLVSRISPAIASVDKLSRSLSALSVTPFLPSPSPLT